MEPEPEPPAADGQQPPAGVARRATLASLAAGLAQRIIHQGVQRVTSQHDAYHGQTDSETEGDPRLSPTCASASEDSEDSDDGATDPRSYPLEAADVRKGLSNLGVTANGTQRAYLALKLTGLGLGDISLLQRFVHLQVVDLSDNQLRDVDALGAMPALLHLRVASNRLRRVLDFTPPCNLKSADYSRNRIVAINDLSAHKFLHTLNISHNRIARITGLQGCPQLTELRLSHNRIKTISGLDNLPLKHLDLSNNLIERIENLDTLSALATLSLADNKISSMQGLEKLSALRSLSLSGNALMDISETTHLRGLPLLTMLVLRINPLQAMPDFRLHLIFRLQALLNLDGQPVDATEKVAAINLCDPSPNVVAAINHALHTSKAVFQPAELRPSTTASIDTPYPLVVLIGPHGCGKRTLRSALIREFPNKFSACLSHTTRAAANGEEEGSDYHFVSEEEFAALVEHGHMLQSSRVNGNLYGLSQAAVDSVAAERKIALLCMELEGAATLAKTHLRPLCVYVCGSSAPSDPARAAQYQSFVEKYGVEFVLRGDAAECLAQAQAEVVPAATRRWDACFSADTGGFR